MIAEWYGPIGREKPAASGASAFGRGTLSALFNGTLSAFLRERLPTLLRESLQALLRGKMPALIRGMPQASSKEILPNDRNYPLISMQMGILVINLKL